MFHELINQSIVRLFLGDMLGEGAFRKVYECIPDKNVVIKVEEGNDFCNMKEFEIYNEILNQHEELVKWLAPCQWITKDGSVMLQKRTNTIHSSMLPKHIPAWLTDTKLSNWGEIDGKVVCHDYGNNFISRDGWMTKSGKVKMKLADWWD